NHPDPRTPEARREEESLKKQFTPTVPPPSPPHPAATAATALSTATTTASCFVTELAPCCVVAELASCCVVAELASCCVIAVTRRRWNNHKVTHSHKIMLR
ncbi:hypothetical protein S83_060094, partial [Arachis hypogaea]